MDRLPTIILYGLCYFLRHLLGKSSSFHILHLSIPINQKKSRLLPDRDSRNHISGIFTWLLELVPSTVIREIPENCHTFALFDLPASEVISSRSLLNGQQIWVYLVPTAPAIRKIWNIRCARRSTLKSHCWLKISDIWVLTVLTHHPNYGGIYPKFKRP